MLKILSKIFGCIRKISKSDWIRKEMNLKKTSVSLRYHVLILVWNCVEIIYKSFCVKSEQQLMFICFRCARKNRGHISKRPNAVFFCFRLLNRLTIVGGPIAVNRKPSWSFQETFTPKRRKRGIYMKKDSMYFMLTNILSSVKILAIQWQTFHLTCGIWSLCSVISANSFFLQSREYCFDV